MRISQTIPAWRDRRHTLEGQTIGLVPTMGALHPGHASLIERSCRENQITVVTLFVNPSQFNDPKDLERYPRTLETDLALLEKLGVDDVIVPPAAELYPHGYRYRIEPDNNAPLMEHAYRPGFLPGVLTIVMKLFQIVRADRAYFGEKDFQQLKAITEMVEEFFLPLTIVPCPTIREDSGLALSSRNNLLSPAARIKAPLIYEAISTSPTPAAARAILEQHGFVVDYVEDHWGRRFAAAFLDGVRLIDNVKL